MKDSGRKVEQDLNQEKQNILTMNSMNYMEKFIEKRWMTKRFFGVAKVGRPKDNGTSLLTWETSGNFCYIRWTEIYLVI